MQDVLKVLYVSTFPPRECGLATFTQDLTSAMDELLHPVIKSRVAAVNEDEVSRYHYPKHVLFQIPRQAESEYVATAERINAMADVQLVNVQHEFGIFGGTRGSHILAFLAALEKPAIVTFHSVLPSPEPELHNLVRAVAAKASGVTVMTGLSKEILVRDYGIPEDTITVIPHGIHAAPYRSSVKRQADARVPPRVHLLTFGLLGRGKGLEYVLEALPEVIKVYPNILYVILGVTHPAVLKEEGERYRNALMQQVRDLGLASHVHFYNEYVSAEELLRYLHAADIYLATSLDPNQAVSGTLSYALGAGRPVISTPFAQAKEVVSAESGILVEFRNPQAYAQAILTLLQAPQLREQLGKNAYFRTRKMTWENVALEYLKMFSRHAAGIAEVSEWKQIPPLTLKHLFRLTDDFGIIQFSWLSFPDASSGYTLDDNARALLVACLCYGKLDRTGQVPPTEKKRRELLRRIAVYVRFIEGVLSQEGVFHNYVKPDRRIEVEGHERENLEDANGRTLWALAAAVSMEVLPEEIRTRARSLLVRRMAHERMLESPRATAFYIKGLCRLCAQTTALEGRHAQRLLIQHCDRLVSLYRGAASEEWSWFEHYLTYSNAVLSDALLLGYQQTGNTDYREIGIKTLEFLIGKTFVGRMYAPIGQEGWYHKAGKRRYFDQQPEDVSAMVCALSTAYAITGDDAYKTRLREAFNWFLGDNSLGQVVYDRITGGCYDGLGEQHVNLNQGAESTISYLLARMALRDAEDVR